MRHYEESVKEVMRGKRVREESEGRRSGGKRVFRLPAKGGVKRVESIRGGGDSCNAGGTTDKETRTEDVRRLSKRICAVSST